MAKLVTVFGASGFLGRHVVRELTKRGHRVRAAMRRPHLAPHLTPMGTVGQVQLFQANLRYPGSVAEAVRGADAVVNLVGVLAPNGKQTFDALQAKGAGTVAKAAAEAGIDNFIHISAIGADADSPSTYARTKAEGEAAVREHVPGATIIRPSIVFGTQDEFFNRFAGMARFSPALPLIGGGQSRFQPVYVDDIADAVVRLIDRQAPTGEIYELGGPEVYTFKELMELTLKIIDRKRALLPLPFFAAKPLGKIGDVVSKLPLVQAPITHDQVLLLEKDNVVAGDGVRTFDDLGIVPETLDAVLPSYLFRYRREGRFSPEVPV